MEQKEKKPSESEGAETPSISLKPTSASGSEEKESKRNISFNNSIEMSTESNGGNYNQGELVDPSPSTGCDFLSFLKLLTFYLHFENVVCCIKMNL